MDTSISKSKIAIYRLKQSGALTNKMLAKILNNEGYYQAKHTKGLWLQKENKDILFILVVDDFVIKYIHKKYIKELVTLLEGT